MNIFEPNIVLNAGTILPEAIVTVTLLSILLIDLIWGATVARLIPALAIAGAGGALAALYAQWGSADPVGFLGSFTADPISIVFRGLLVITVAIVVLMSVRYINQSGTSAPEFYILLLTATLGGMFLAGSTDMVMLFVALETLSISSYLMAGYTKRDPRSNEAALKYLLVGASSTAIFLYGMSLLYGLSGGETLLENIAPALANAGLAGTLALVFCISGIAFKLAVVPFHQWTPDVYEGSPTPVVAFLSVGSKAAGFALALRFLTTVFPALTDEWQAVLTVLAILTMILGNVVALAQNSMKRLLAYSSIAQAGFVLIGLAIGTEAGYSSALFYLIIYLFMNLGAFLCVTLFALQTGTDEIAEYSGLYQKDPFLTLCLTVCLLSLGGIPPMAGFFGKIYLFWAGWQAEAYALVLVGLFTSVISIYYYVRVIKMMVVKEPQEMSEAVQNYPEPDWQLPGMRPLQLGMAITLAVTVLAGILSNPLFDLTTQSVTRSAFLQWPVVTQTAIAASPEVAIAPLDTPAARSR
ncbi:NAD(P)H-quinone oxidoreductase subunit N [Synechococcus sp. PCC 7336]|uniref:NAD(P)H-quinone oxidoreductase subunit N n=1 Tax=Synechococcus sp. PCC 7336 TaxID=195250 RepID=UPI00034C858A|nr:NAD(P)H-quinone oxidoreductase subunit N [Synechococcus sp. PCC 7336]